MNREPMSDNTPSNPPLSREEVEYNEALMRRPDIIAVIDANLDDPDRLIPFTTASRREQTA